jgi:hypothetical protein
VALRRSDLSFRRPPATGLLGHYPDRTFTGKSTTASGHTPPQLTNRPSLHAASLTPERFRAAPDPEARTAAFAQLCRARPSRSLTGSSFDAAEFMFITACSFAPPRFDAGLSPDVGEFATPLLWRLAGAGLAPAGRLALRLGTPQSEPRRSATVDVI